MNKNKINNILVNTLYKRGWKIAFNEVDAIYTDKVLDIASDFEIHKQKCFEQVFVKGYAINDILLKVVIDNIDDEKMLQYLERHNENVVEYNRLLKEMRELCLQECSKIKAYDDIIEDIILPYAKDMTDIHEIYTRLQTLKAKFFNMLISLNFHKADEEGDNSIFNENTNILKKLRQHRINQIEQEIQNIKEESQTEFTQKKENPKQKIFDYKEMNKFAEINNYRFARIKGDHKVYVHNVTNKIAVIPQHTLSRGLMFSLQNQIKQNALQ